MTVPVQNTQIVGQGLARLTSAFITQPNIRALLSVYLAPKQQLENTLWQVIRGRWLANATIYSPTATSGPTSNVVFDNIGALVGLSRSVPVSGPPSISDVDFQALIYLAIACNRAVGRTTDWSGFAEILAPWDDGCVYIDGDNANFWFGAWDLSLSPEIVSRLLTRATPNGVYACFMYSTWADGDDFSFSSVYETSVGEAGFSSVYSPSVGGLLVACFGLSAP